MVRLARSRARHPVAPPNRNPGVTYHSDKAAGRTAGRETLDALEFLARAW